MNIIQMPSKFESLSVVSRCSLLEVSRSSYYRYRSQKGVVKEDPAKSTLLEQAFEHLHYGYRRMTKALKSVGHVVNHKRVLKLMRQENLVLRPLKPRSAPAEVEQTLGGLKDLKKDVVLTRINQLWAADTTYIRLNGKWVYLAIVLDCFSRKCVGWAVSRLHNTALLTTAIRRALRNREPKPGLIHHSDQGSQYTSVNYVKWLLEAESKVSFSRPGMPGDNAFAESFIKTIKKELIYPNKFKSYDELRYEINSYLESYYNTRRIHSGLNYISPAEFEEIHLNQQH